MHPLEGAYLDTAEEHRAETKGKLDTMEISRAELLTRMSIHDVQEYLADGFTYEEVCAELSRRRAEEIAEAEAESAAEAEEIAEEIAPAPSVIAMDTVPQDSVTLTLNGKTEDISSLHGVARTAAEILLRAGLDYRAAREAVREVIEGCINADDTKIQVATAQGVLTFTAHYSN